MAKKKKSSRSRSRKAAQVKPQHEVPSGFWRQVGALALIVFAILLVVTWFGAGGVVLQAFNDVLLDTIGYAVYVLPFVCLYIAVEIFRAEENRLAFVVHLATLLLITWFAGLFGLLRKDGAASTGGFIGDTLNTLTLAMVNEPMAVFVYVVLIAVTMLFVLRLSPFAVFQKVRELTARENKDELAENVKVMRRVAEDEDKGKAKSKISDDFKLNAGVPMMSAEDRKKKAGLSSLRGSVKQDKEAEAKTALVSVTDPNWESPSLDLLEKKQSPADPGDIEQNAQIIQDTLHEFSIDVKMEGANIGPKVTQYTLSPPSGVKLTRITALETNLALNLAAQSLRIEAPIPGQRAVGIEVPNTKAADVRLYGILSDGAWTKATEPLSFAIGKDISGDPVVGKLNKMPHLLIAGQTGSGKSVMINTLLASLLYRNSPSDMKLILVDPKQVEMAPYADIPHLLTPVIVEPEKTISALKWAVNEMERRYSLLAEEKVRDIASYNNHVKKRGKTVPVADEHGNVQQMDEGKMPYIVIVIDELADLMMVAARDVEALIVRLAQKARAVGIHMVLATQRPSVDVITGLIKANVPARIAFTVASQVDSRTILDQIGAEKLLGMGDMLFKTADMSKPKRIQGAWVMDSEVGKITDHLRMQSAPQYNDEIISQPVQLNGKGGVVMDMDGGSGDDEFRDAVRVVVEARKASTSLLQRKLRIGYGKAARIMEEMEEQGIIGAQDGSRPRDVLITSLADLDATSSISDES